MNRRHIIQGLSMSLLSGRLLRSSPLQGLVMEVRDGNSATSDRPDYRDAHGSRSLPARTFIFGNASRNLDDFRAYAEAATRLKPYGDVQIEIGELADKSWYEMPASNSPWHEYANEFHCIAKFFPHPKIAPFIPADWVAKNREMLLAKAAVLRQLGIHGAFAGDETHFLPASFFEQYPHLRGPRVDHPRRSTHPEFSWCVDLEETREMIEWMTAELIRNVPEIKSIGSYNNDSGGGLCWSDTLYTGPNGPSHCAHRTAGIRMKEYMEAMHRGAAKAGCDVAIRVSGYFSKNEGQLVREMLPPNTVLDNGSDPTSIGIGSLLNQAYPAKNLLDIVALQTTLEKLDDPAVKTISIGTTEWYDRAEESLSTVEKLIEVQQECLAYPGRGFVSRFDKLHRLALQWGGERNADAVIEAVYSMNEAFLLKDAVAPQYSNFYCYVSTRYVLTPQEEAYFLPHVFNVSESEARNDYADMHGGRIIGPAAWDDAGLQNALARALRAAEILEGVMGAPSQRWLKQVALALRIWASGVRSMNNFYFGQLVRDRSSAAIARGAFTPSKQFSATGNSDYGEWSRIQRDELDNTNELIVLLRDGGLESIAYTKDKRYEDTFLLGPDVLHALHEKTRLMEREWLDVQKYLASPLD
jgi:hypothetical protein